MANLFVVKQLFFDDGRIEVSVFPVDELTENHHVRHKDHELFFDVFSSEEEAENFAFCIRLYGGVSSGRQSTKNGRELYKRVYSVMRSLQKLPAKIQSFLGLQ